MLVLMASRVAKSCMYCVAAQDDSRSCEGCHEYAGKTRNLTTCIDVAKQFTGIATITQLAMLCFAAHLYVTYVPSNSQANTINSFQIKAFLQITDTGNAANFC